ncbi:hypothetical protein A7A08_01418 [Methyloligella halotolerans]|uniref:Uncharacterized protein n=2 Tax=Methyloligella halotolerans TaxID=1177755 RepID=A0A1E2RYR9_9HYPH|nr:hypothetical protein A7A08_01418 [Methyloligella halotolerans]
MATIETPAIPDEPLDRGTAPAEALAQAWVEGRLERSAGPGHTLRKVPLPGYAFDKRSFWIGDLKAPEAEAREREQVVQKPAPIRQDREKTERRENGVSRAPEPARPKAPITPEAILEKVDQGELDPAAAQAMLESLMESEKAA